MERKAVPLSPTLARRLWIHAQRLDVDVPFGSGPEAVRLAVEHLGYVQIDTISVIERSHHHILHSRIPDYARADLEHAQSTERSVFEYWTHALAYVPSADYRFFAPAMARFKAEPHRTFAGVDPADYAALLERRAPPSCGSPGMPHRIMLNSRSPSAAWRTIGARMSGNTPGIGSRLPVRSRPIAKS